jgi:hypothetical protein
VEAMVLLDPIVVDEAYTKSQNRLNDLTFESGMKHISKAYLICNEFLEWNDTGVIQTKCLKSLQSHFQGKDPVFLSREGNHEIVIHGDTDVNHSGCIKCTCHPAESTRKMKRDFSVAKSVSRSSTQQSSKLESYCLALQLPMVPYLERHNPSSLI